MAIALTHERKLINTAVCEATDLIMFEFYGKLEDSNSGKKIIIEIKPVSQYEGRILSPSVTSTYPVRLPDGTYTDMSIVAHPLGWTLNQYTTIFSNVPYDEYVTNYSISFNIGNASITLDGTTYQISFTNSVSVSIYPTVWVKFDNTRISDDAILGLHQEASLFTGSFKLGSTVCRSVKLSVLKTYVSSVPENVTFYDDEANVVMTLLVDSVDDTNIDFYEFTLVDSMVLLNSNYNYSNLTSYTAQNILNAICTNILHCATPSFSYGTDIVLQYSTDVSARDIVSWIAEINGCFARIDEQGDLKFIPFSNSTVATDVDINTCGDITIGEHHIIDRVYLELATGTEYYPTSSTNDTLYLNPQNQLFTDSGSYTISGMIQHIYSLINGFEFYSLKSNRCEINQRSLAGDIISFNNGSDSYRTIAQIDWNYNGAWYGGYSCEIETKQQQETKVIGNNISNQIKIVVDRELGTITQEISQLDENLNQATTSFNQTANSLEVRVTNTETGLTQNNDRLSSYETVVNIQTDGVRISQGTEGAYVLFTDSGMEIYVEGTKTAWAEADGFSSSELMIGDASSTQKWHLHEANDGNTLMFLRR